MLWPPVQAYWASSPWEGSLGEDEDATWSRSAWAGRKLENQGPFSSAMTRFLASRSMAKAD